MEVNVDGLYSVSPMINSAIGGCQEAIEVLGSVQVPNSHVSASINFINLAIDSLQTCQGGVSSVIDNVIASEERNNSIVSSIMGSISGFSIGSSVANNTTQSNTTGKTDGINVTTPATKGTKTDTSKAEQLLNGFALFKSFGQETAQKIINSILEDYSDGKLDILKMTDEELTNLIYERAKEYLGKDVVKIMQQGNFDELMAKRINQVILDKQINLANKTDEEFKEIINNISVTVKLENLNNDEAFEYFQGISGAYGYKPNDLEELFDYKNGDEIDVDKFFKIKNILENTYGMTDTAEAAKFIEGFNNSNMNEYTSVANTLLEEYKDNPEKFKQDFGVSLYKQNEEGILTINNEVLLDIYVTVNRTNVGNIDNGGQNINNKTTSEILTTYLAAKKVDLGCTETAVKDMETSENAETIKNKVEEAMKLKQNLTIQIKNDSSSGINLINEETSKTVFSSSNGKINEINEACVTGYNEKGVLISYKGEKCIINFSDLEHNNSYSLKAIKIRKYKISQTKRT